MTAKIIPAEPTVQITMTRTEAEALMHESCGVSTKLFPAIVTLNRALRSITEKRPL